MMAVGSWQKLGLRGVHKNAKRNSKKKREDISIVTTTLMLII